MQVYFLSVLTSLAVGLMLFFEDKTAEIKYLNEIKVRLIIGIVAAVVGLLKLFVVAKVPVVGDLFPVIAGLAGGFTLLLEFYMRNSNTEVSVETAETENPESESEAAVAAEKIKDNSVIQKIFVANKKTIGVLCMGVAVLHFLFPTVLFL